MKSMNTKNILGLAVRSALGVSTEMQPLSSIHRQVSTTQPAEVYTTGKKTIRDDSVLPYPVQEQQSGAGDHYDVVIETFECPN